MHPTATTKPIERSHIATRDRLRSSRGIKTLATGQRFFEGFEAVQALGRGSIHLERLVPGYRALGATLRRAFTGWRAALLVPEDTGLSRALGLPEARSLPVRNGGLRCRLLLCELPASPPRG